MQRHLWERIIQRCKIVVQNEENLTLKQMFDITAQTIHKRNLLFGQSRVSEFLDTTVVDQ